MQTVTLHVGILPQFSCYRIASISKVFPTIFLYKLWEDGDVELSDPITKYAPNFSVGKPVNFTGELTLHDLASQVNGLQRCLWFNCSIFLCFYRQVSHKKISQISFLTVVLRLNFVHFGQFSKLDCRQRCFRLVNSHQQLSKLVRWSIQTTGKNKFQQRFLTPLA